MFARPKTGIRGMLPLLENALHIYCSQDTCFLSENSIQLVSHHPTVLIWPIWLFLLPPTVEEKICRNRFDGPEEARLMFQDASGPCQRIDGITVLIVGFIVWSFAWSVLVNTLRSCENLIRLRYVVFECNKTFVLSLVIYPLFFTVQLLMLTLYNLDNLIFQ